MSIIKFPPDGAMDGRSDRSFERERLTPQSLEAEQSTLGAMLLDASAVDSARALVEVHDFYRENHRVIFQTIEEMRDAGTAVDVITVMLEMQRRRTLDECGGAPYLLVLKESCPSSVNVASYATVVRDTSTQRKIIDATTRITTAVYEGDSEAKEAAEAKLAAAQALAANPRGTKRKRRFQLLSCDEVEALEPPAPLIDELLGTQTLVVISGPPGCYKSFLALDMGFCIATGQPWNGRPVAQGEVVYVAAEGAQGLGKRLRAWRTFHGHHIAPPLWTITEAPRMTLQSEVDELIDDLREVATPPKLIVLDTLARCMSGDDENAQKDMGLVVAHAGRLQQEFGATVIVIHHAGKNGLIRGSSVLPGAVDTAIEVTADDLKCTMRYAKQKDLPKFDPMTFRMEKVGERPLGSLVPIPSADEPVTTEPKVDKSELAWEILRDKFPNGARASEWAAACKEHMANGTFYTAKERLVDAGRIATVLNKFMAVEPKKRSNSNSNKNETGFGVN